MTDDELRRLATLVVDELLGRLVSRPANDTRPKVTRRQRYDVPPEADEVAEEMARQALRRRGVVVR